ncbi:MAG: GAF domain-containing protein [Leptolyngbyaceae cyanobacterium SL_7_1]|nr:GAF domain-containing protein [Leptolyngbyaceae cyanobacterium SL_7_1]
MILNTDWQALRDCCRDDAAFVRLQKLLELDHGNGHTANQTSQQESIAQTDLLRGIVEAISQLLTGSNYSEAIATALRILGEATSVDRVYIFDIHPHLETGEPATSQQFEWVRKSISPQINNPRLQNRGLISSGLGRWYGLLQQGRSFNAIVRELPPAEQAVLVVQDIQSVLIVPIQVGGELRGFVGFDDCSRERRWSGAEEAALQIVAASLGGRSPVSKAKPATERW